MFIAYGVKGLIIGFNLQFWVFYVSLCSVTIWIAFRFMTSEKALKYDVLGRLSKFSLKNEVDNIMDTEGLLDDAVQPDQPIEEPKN